MKKILSIILVSLITLSVFGQNLKLDNYQANYDINDVAITDSTIKFTNGFLNLQVDSTVSMSFDTPVRCSGVIIDAAGYSPLNVKGIATYEEQDYSSSLSLVKDVIVNDDVRLYFDATVDGEFNMKTFTFVTLGAALEIDSIKFFIDTSVVVESEYDMGVASVDTTESWNNGYTSGVESVDTISVWDNGVAYGVESVDTTESWNNGYTSGVESVDTISVWDNGVASVDTISVWDNGVASVDTTESWNNGYTSGVESVDTDSYYNDGYNDGVESVDTTESWSNGYTSGVESVDTDSYFNSGYSTGYGDGVESVDTTESWNNGYLTGYNVGLNDCQSTGKIDMNSLDETTVYPNPTTDWVTVDKSDVDHVEVYDITGLLLETQYSNSVSLVNYDTGVYFLRIFTHNTELGVVKILKQ